MPAEYRDRRSEYVDLVINDMIPRVAAAGLAKYCDVFCEDGVFSPAEATAILDAGRASGLTPRIHADELAASGGSLVAATVRARSADHLVFVAPEGIDALEASFRVEQLREADEIFVTGTSSGIVPIVTLAGAMIGTGRVGPVTRRLMEL